MSEKTESANKNGQSRDTGNIKNIRHKTKTNNNKKHNTIQYVLNTAMLGLILVFVGYKFERSSPSYHLR